MPNWIKKPKKQYYKKDIKITLSQKQAWRMVKEREGVKLKDEFGNVTYQESDMYPYLKEPLVRYELKGDKIIRTVNTLQWLAQCTERDGKCNSFRHIQRKYIAKTGLHGKEEIEGVHDIVWKAFGIWYHVGKKQWHESGESDLDIPIRWVSFMIMGNQKYYLVQMKKEDGTWTSWRMFAAKYRVFELNNKTPLRMSQEEIIQELKDLNIDYVYEYGKPKSLLYPIEVLRILLPLEYSN